MEVDTGVIDRTSVACSRRFCPGWFSVMVATVKHALPVIGFVSQFVWWVSSGAV
jgi:hypothetical protein